MGLIWQPKSHVSIATLVGLFPATAMEMRDCECGPFRPNFAAFANLDHVENTISPLRRGPSQKEKAILVAYDQESIGPGFRICSSGLARVAQRTVHATLPNFASLSVFRTIV